MSRPLRGLARFRESSPGSLARALASPGAIERDAGFAGSRDWAAWSDPRHSQQWYADDVLRIVNRSALVLGVTLALAAIAAAQFRIPAAPTGFVNDFANVVDAKNRDRMETMSRNFRAATNIDVAVVTVASLDGRDIRDVGLQIGRTWGIGGGQEAEGVLILLAPNDRKSDIEVSRHLEDEITDGVAGSILRSARPYFAGGDYGGGLSVTLESVLATIAAKKGISIEGIDQKRAVVERSQGTSSASEKLVALFVLVFVLFVVIAIIKSNQGGGRGGRRRRFGGPFFIPMGGWGGGSSGSSWGGGGGGGSDWGGFGGGGDFGGGGASDSW